MTVRVVHTSKPERCLGDQSDKRVLNQRRGTDLGVATLEEE
jgi:hypothetical protein